MKHGSLALLILLAASSSLAQLKEDPGLTRFPAPQWPADGAVPAEFRDRYVFLDLPQGEFVVAFPENLGTPEFEKDPGPLEVRRFALARNVEPAVSAVVTTLGPSLYKYDYTITNAATAKDWIDNWNIVLPERSGNTTAAHPADWLSYLQKGRSFTVRDPNWIRTGSSVFWFNGKTQGQTVVDLKPAGIVQPGTAKGGFVLESNLRPGFTIAYFRKYLGSSGPDPAYPEPVRNQLEDLMKLEFNSRTALTLGPKFEHDIPDHAVVSDFIEGISFLSRSGDLDPNSEFVRNVMDELGRYGKAIHDNADAPPIRLTSQAQTRLESEIMNGLKICLRLN